MKKRRSSRLPITDWSPISTRRFRNWRRSWASSAVDDRAKHDVAAGVGGEKGGKKDRGEKGPKKPLRPKRGSYSRERGGRRRGKGQRHRRCQRAGRTRRQAQ